ncbi:MAG: flagellin, partial [Selenomonadaceae bacterium]|nr:flagellin [Selenomonadaceae bacterium]
MAMVVKNNMSAITTLNTLNKNSGALSKSLGKVSTGMRMNSAADDSSGYAISERMRVQIRSLDQDNRNAQNGSSMMKVAEGAVNSTIEILKTLKEKVINAANDTNTDSDRATIQKELDQSIDQIDDNANVTYNGKYLLDGSKNNKGVATHTTLTNQNLHTDTQATTKLTDLKSRAGDDLQIQKTDQITVSYVQSGKTYSTTFQAGDNDLQAIFNNAENIDTTTKTFASSDVGSVATAMDVSKANSGDAQAVKKAVAALRATLGHDVGSTINGVSFKGPNGQGDTKTNNDNAISAGDADFTVTFPGTGLRGETVVLSGGLNTADTNGELWKEVKAAGNDAQNAYKAMMAAGKELASAFATESTKLTWDHQNGTNVAALRNETSRDLISQMSSTTQALYEDYLKKADTFDTNKAKAEELVNKYNDSIKELNALKIEDKFYDARKDYDRSVETFLSNLEETAANTEAEQFSYTDSNGNTQTSAALDSNRGKFVKEMISDLRKQFQNVDPGNNATTANDAEKIMKSIKVGNETVAGGGTNMTSTYSTLNTSAKDVTTSNGKGGKAAALNVAYAALKSVETDLEKAHNDAFKQYSGPQL